MRIFVLEDDGYRVKFFLEKFCDYDITITENAQSAIEYLEDNVFDYLFLDHDLGDGNGSGLEVVEYLDENPWNENNRSVIVIHSWNEPASKTMINVLPQARHIPFDVAFYSAMDLY